MKIRFIKEGDLYSLQIRNFIGIWRTQKEKRGSDGGYFYDPYQHKNKEILLNYVLMDIYFNKKRGLITEYPTIKKYKSI